MRKGEGQYTARSCRPSPKLEEARKLLTVQSGSSDEHEIPKRIAPDDHEADELGTGDLSVKEAGSAEGSAPSEAKRLSALQTTYPAGVDQHGNNESKRESRFGHAERSLKP